MHDAMVKCHNDKIEKKIDTDVRSGGRHVIQQLLQKLWVEIADAYGRQFALAQVRTSF